MDKKYLKIKKTKLLKSKPETKEQFEDVQRKLDEVELELLLKEVEN